MNQAKHEGGEALWRKNAANVRVANASTSTHQKATWCGSKLPKRQRLRASPTSMLMHVGTGCRAIRNTIAPEKNAHGNAIFRKEPREAPSFFLLNYRFRSFLIRNAPAAIAPSTPSVRLPLYFTNAFASTQPKSRARLSAPALTALLTFAGNVSAGVHW